MVLKAVVVVISAAVVVALTVVLVKVGIVADVVGIRDVALLVEVVVTVMYSIIV